MDLNDNLLKRIPVNYSKIENKSPSLNIKKIMRNDEENELILFELPKGFDRTLLNRIKIKNFGNSGKISKLTGNFHGINFDSTHPIPKQTLGLFMKKNKNSFIFRQMDKYVKVFEHIEMPTPNTESIIPRRIKIKNSLGKKRRKNKSKKSV
jgi:hypothetical protein